MSGLKKLQTLQWKIGDVRITSVPESEDPTGPRFIYRDVDKTRVQAICKANPWIAPLFVTKTGNLILRIQALIVDTGAHRIVIDPCVGNDKLRNGGPHHMLKTDLLERIEAAGYPLDSFTEVVCTHMHHDHVGGNTRFVDGKWVPAFPNATYVFGATEFAYWKTAHYDEGDVFGDSVQPIADAGKAKLVEPTHRLCPEVSFMATHGHTPGHFSVVIESRGERAVITGDAIHNCVQIAEPSITSVFDYDSPAAHRTRVEFLKRWTDGKTIMIGTHFANPTAGILRDRGSEHWELDPGPEGARVAAAQGGRL